MDREEVLEKSRFENNDEGFFDAENQGRKLGIWAFCIMEVAIMAFNWFTGQPNHIPLAMFWAFSAIEAYPKYKFTKKKSFLWTTIIGSTAAVCSLACHIITVIAAMQR